MAAAEYSYCKKNPGSFSNGTKLLSQLSEQLYTFRVDTESLLLENKQHSLIFKPLN
jgi:hypothetical protein